MKPLARHPLRRLWAPACAAGLLAAVGCVDQAKLDAAQAVADYQGADYADARRLLRPLAHDGNEDYVLNNCRLGSTCLPMYDLADAQAALTRAYQVINAYGVNDGGRTVGSVVLYEGIRIWRGEPFERAMANFYLGLTYYMQRDYNNARAAFENALFKLRDYGPGDPQDDRYQLVDSDFTLARYMLARCYQQLGNTAQANANFAAVTRDRPDLAALADPGRNAAANVLVVVDYGMGPRKAVSPGGYVTGFVPPPQAAGPLPLPQIDVDGRYATQPGSNAPLVDLLALAQDTRWQAIDTIRTVKSALGSGLIAGGGVTALAARNRDVGYAGLGLLAAGVLLKATSAPDLRSWDTLPRSTFAVALRVPPGKHDLTVTFPTYGGQRQVWHGVIIPATGEVTYYVRMHRYEANDQAWPPPTLTGWPEAAATP